MCCTHKKVHLRYQINHQIGVLKSFSVFKISNEYQTKEAKSKTLNKERQKEAPQLSMGRSWLRRLY